MNSWVWILWRVLSVSIHLIAVSLYGFSLIFQFVYPSGYYPKPQTDDQTINSTDTKDFSFGWKYKYLTFWNMNFQFIIFAIHLLCDCFKVHYLPSKAIESRFTKHLFRIRDTLFHSVLFPIGWFVSTMYWALYVINKSYVVNGADLYPWWMTHCGHSIVVPILLLEAVTTYHRRSRLAIEMSILMVLIGAYIVWVYYLGLAQHIWVYGILRTMSSVNRAVILCGFAVYSIVLYLFGLLLHKIVWPKRRVDAWPQQWSPDEISIGQLEFENFRVRQGLIR